MRKINPSKPLPGQRLTEQILNLLCDISIGKAENYRFYRKDLFDFKGSNWLDPKNEKGAGNFKVKYSNEDWQQILPCDTEACLDKIIASGFGGVYMDILDGYEYF